MFFNKGKIQIFLIGLFFWCFFLFGDSVSAANKLYYCDYNINMASEGAKIPFKIIVYDNETIKFENGSHSLSTSNDFFYLQNGSTFGSVGLNINIKYGDMKQNGRDYCPDLNLNVTNSFNYILKVGNVGTAVNQYYTTTGGEPKYYSENENPNKVTLTHSCDNFNFLSSSSEANEMLLYFDFKLKLNMYNTGQREMCVNIKGVDEACSYVRNNSGMLTQYNDGFNSYGFIIEKDEVDQFFKQNTGHELNQNIFICPETIYVYYANQSDYFFTLDKEKAQYESSGYGELTPDVPGESEKDTLINECDTIPESIRTYILQALKLIRWVGLAAMVILGVLDFTKAVASDDQDALKKAWGNFTKRLIAVIILFLIPMLIELILYLADIPTCGI